MSDALANMTPEQLAAIPAAVPPPGVQSNLIDPPSKGPVLIIVGAVFVGIMMIFSGMRFYFKAIVRRKMTPDDWTTLAAVIGTFWYYGICVHAVTKAKFGTHMWDISVAETLSDDFLIASFFTNWPTGLVWAFAKTSFFLMYLQIFSPLTWLRVSVYIGLFLNWGFYTAVIAASIYYQVPNPGQTWQQGFMNERYTRSFNMTIPIASGSLFLDTYIFVLPLIAVSNMHLTLAKKLGVIAVFATGLAACVASSLSIYFKHVLGNNLTDYTYWIYPVLLMALLEMCIGISCSCMPSATGFFKSTFGGCGTWGTSTLGFFRSLLPYGSKHSNTSGVSSGSWKNSSPHSTQKNQYIDIEMEQQLTQGAPYEHSREHSRRGSSVA
ncbi:hypothetical protein GQ53DRAFT_723925 [Thozetella sp. PMI_491]|nr:hypothetical protein GQ53DRAFT_723925 [Thozetella sp. PMI_491]